MNQPPNWQPGPPPGQWTPTGTTNYQQPYQGQPQPYYPPQQPPMMQPVQPPKRKPNKLVLGCTGLVIIIFLIIAIAAASAGSHSTGTTTATTQADNVTTVPTKALAWQTTHTYTGSGSKKTENITVGDSWKIQWSCTPGSFAGIESYNVIASVMKPDNTPLDYGAINTICKAGNASGETEEHKGGTVYLDIVSEGDWTFTVQEPK